MWAGVARWPAHANSLQFCRLWLSPHCACRDAFALPQPTFPFSLSVYSGMARAALLRRAETAGAEHGCHLYHPPLLYLLTHWHMPSLPTLSSASHHTHLSHNTISTLTSLLSPSLFPPSLCCPTTHLLLLHLLLSCLFLSSPPALLICHVLTRHLIMCMWFDSCELKREADAASHHSSAGRG